MPPTLQTFSSISCLYFRFHISEIFCLWIPFYFPLLWILKFHSNSLLVSQSIILSDPYPDTVYPKFCHESTKWYIIKWFVLHILHFYYYWYTLSNFLIAFWHQSVSFISLFVILPLTVTIETKYLTSWFMVFHPLPNLWRQALDQCVDLITGFNRIFD